MNFPYNKFTFKEKSRTAPKKQWLCNYIGRYMEKDTQLSNYEAARKKKSVQKHASSINYINRNEFKASSLGMPVRGRRGRFIVQIILLQGMVWYVYKQTSTMRCAVIKSIIIGCTEEASGAGPLRPPMPIPPGIQMAIIIYNIYNLFVRTRLYSCQTCSIQSYIQVSRRWRLG